MQDVKIDFLKRFLKIIIIFVVALILVELFLGNYFITTLSARIEKDRRQELIESWDNFYSQKKQEFVSIVHGYGWWDELAQAFIRQDDQKVIELFAGDRFLTEKYDLLLAVNENNRFIYSVYKGQIIFNNQPENQQLKNEALQQKFYKLSSAAYRGVQADTNLLRLLRSGKSDASVKSFWHCVSYLKGKPMILTLSSVCNNWGYPVSPGYLIFGRSLTAIIREAEKIIPAQIRISSSPQKSAYSQTVIKSECGDALFYISMEPHYKIYQVLKEAMFVFILIQIILVTLLFALALPVFNRRQTRYLQKIINERTATISEVNDELTRTNYELLSALANIKTLSGFLPICASCKKIRNDQGYWSQVESFIQDNSEVVFSHSLCPECINKLYPEIAHKVNTSED